MSRLLTIEQYALRIAGPREFVLNLLINTIVPYLVYRGQETVPLFGESSAARIFVPMMAIMSGLTTFGAYAGGIFQRRRGKISPPWVRGTPWFLTAARDGLICGLVAMCIAWGLALAAKQYDPDAHVSYWTANIGLGLSSAFVAFYMHSTAMIRSGKLGVA